MGSRLDSGSSGPGGVGRSGRTGFWPCMFSLLVSSASAKVGVLPVSAAFAAVIISLASSRTSASHRVIAALYSSIASWYCSISGPDFHFSSGDSTSTIGSGLSFGSPDHHISLPVVLSMKVCLAARSSSVGGAVILDRICSNSFSGSFSASSRVASSEKRFDPRTLSSLSNTARSFALSSAEYLSSSMSCLVSAISPSTHVRAALVSSIPISNACLPSCISRAR